MRNRLTILLLLGLLAAMAPALAHRCSAALLDKKKITEPGSTTAKSTR